MILTIGYPISYNKLNNIFFKDQANALAKGGHKVGVLAIVPVGLQEVFRQQKFDFGLRQYIENEVNTYVFQYPSLPKFPTQWPYIALVKGKSIFRDYVKKAGIPDIIHVQRFEAGLLAGWIKRKYKIPFVVTEHSTVFASNGLTPKMNKIATRVFTNSDCNIAVSEPFVKLLSKRYGQNFKFVPNIVNTDHFQPYSGIGKNEDFTFINVGNIILNKNQEMLINAFVKCFLKDAKITLSIIGDGVLLPHLKNLVKKAGREKQILFLGKLDRGEIRKELAKSHIFVLPSIRETFGVVLIEALSMGLPLIATRCGGPESIITEDKIGYLCDINVKSIGTAMKNAYEGYNDFYHQHKLREIAINNFSERAVVQKLSLIYSEILRNSLN